MWAVRESTCSSSSAVTFYTTGSFHVDGKASTTLGTCWFSRRLLLVIQYWAAVWRGEEQHYHSNHVPSSDILILRASSKAIISRTCHPHSARTVSHHRAISFQASGKHMSPSLVPFFCLHIDPYSILQHTHQDAPEIKRQTLTEPLYHINAAASKHTRCEHNHWSRSYSRQSNWKTLPVTCP